MEHTQSHNQVLAFTGPNLRREQIVHRLNMLNFKSKPFTVIVRHKTYGYSITLEAIPKACSGDSLQAIWVENDQLPRNINQYDLIKIIIPDVTMAIEFLPEKAQLENDGIRAEIPESFQATSGRAIGRQRGSETITARLIQNSVSFDAQLVDYSPQGMRLSVTVAKSQSSLWFNIDQKITLTLAQQDQIVFSGPVKVLRDKGDRDHRLMVVAPTESQSPRYRPKKERTRRVTTHPSPDITFIHPLTQINTSLSVCDISTLGFSVKETADQAVLFPGLILNNINLNLFGSCFLTLTGQVVYQRTEDEGVVCGIAILEISIDDHFQLIGLIHRAENENSFVQLSHDPDKYFEFLFDTGFLYPSKYETIYRNRDAFIDAHRKLYLNPNQIARCFVYVENGQILGHVSALKIYRHTWLNHHHAALSGRRSGLRVLRQISDFHNDSYVLNPLQMRYIVGIWRPDNSFPDRFFGGFARKIGDPQKCSMDRFSYFQATESNCNNWDDLTGPWEVQEASKQDLFEFEGFYDQASGGLLAKAFDLTTTSYDDKSVANEYEVNGLKRERQVYAVRYGLDLKVLIEVQNSDAGLNLSELTSATYIYILDQEMVTPAVLKYIQCVISTKQLRETNTIMLYPHTYAERYQLKTEKEYTVWILNLDASDDYMSHLKRWC